jgi:hypothetical protein
MENILIFVLAGILTVLALVSGLIMAAEMVRLGREFLANLAEARRQLPPFDAETPASPQRRVSGAKNRATVQRMIRAFEDSQDARPPKADES